MANITIWPSQPLDGDQWERNTWDIGTPITKEKLENLEEGIAVLATQMEALLREIEIDPSTIILNGTRLDTIQKWITAAEDGNYDFTKGSIAARLANIDTLNSTQNNRLNNIENVNSTQSTDISSLKTRATDIENVNTTQNNRLTALENELSGSGTGTSGSSRLDNLQTWITGSSTSTYSGATIASRLEEIDTLNSTQNTRLNTDETDIGTLKTDNSTNKTNISNIINEIGGTYTSSGFTNSQISKIPSIIEKNDTQDSNIGKIKLEVWGPNKDFNDESRIDTLESGLSTTNSTVLNHESRISRIETGAVAAKILNYTTTNTSASDSLILPANSLLDKNSIIMVFLNAATLGTNNLTIKDSANTYNIKVNNQTNSNLKTKFAAGSLLGLYRGDTNDIYMFNAPLAI